MANINANFYRKLRNLKDEQSLMNVLQKNADMCRNMIADLAPKRTGEYAASIQSEIHKTDTGIVGTVFTPMKDLRDWLEHGTGIYRDDGTGRQTPWVYPGTDFMTFYWTQGMRPQPHWGQAITATRIQKKKDIKELFR